ncbi:LytR/AlgR family response regulator transcription factor [Siminovitchia fordii]|uniref:DNA-binding response regulator n=1 Tax=Siminovitchia fordii TaxID=254759 RepID=A0ABQ4K6B3_9BACI|nr:LytTR family DNA-binding domain-containing protein [Siminovitchia fordii]GIN21277.1 DNA-binding response regulator [Siminovitchia fordii]
MTIRVMVAEDERLVREELIYMLQQEKDFLLCPSAESGEQLLELYEKFEPDVIFLDIHMPLMSGVDVAKKLTKDKENPPLFVFITAYDDYALEAFEVEAVDYLLKPYDESRLKEAVDRIRRRHLSSSKSDSPNEKNKRNSTNLIPASSKLLIDDGEKVVVLSPESIYYATRVERFVEIHTADEFVQGKMTLQELEEKLKGFPFFRTHRSYLVNLDFIQEITPWFNGAYNLILKGEKKTRIPVSRSAQKKLFQLLGQ